MIRVLVAEDNALVRESVVSLLTAAGDITVVSECTDGDEVLAEALRTCPDVVLMDMSMQRMGGIEATRVLLASCPETRVVMLTGSLSAPRVREAHALGASGFLLKGDDPRDLITGVRTVAAGGTAWGAPALACLDEGRRVRQH